MQEIEKEIHLRDYLRIVQKRKLVIITFFTITFIMVVIATFTATPEYDAATKVLIEKSDPNPMMLNYAYMPYDPEFLTTQSHIIKSASVAEKVINILNLEKTYDTFMEQHEKGFSIIGAVAGWVSSFISTVKDVLGATSEASLEETAPVDAAEAKRNALIDMISNCIVVSPVPESRIVSINFTSPNPELATMITNTVAKAYIEQILDMRMKSSGYSIGWMTEKAEEERGKLEKSEDALQQYMKEANIVTLEDRVTILPQKLAELSRQLTMAQTKRKELEAVYNKVMALNKNPGDAETLPIVADNPTLLSLNQQVLKAEQLIMELSKKYGPKHPLMKRAVADIDILTGKRDREIDRIIKSIKNDYELAKSTEENFQTLLSNTKSEAISLNERSVQYGMLKREVETNRNLYNALVAKIKEQNVTEQIQTVNVWVVEEAKVPEYPSKPNKKRNILLGIILGMFGGVGLAFFLEYLDNTVKLPEDVEDRLGLPTLGLVPHVDPKDKSDGEILMTEARAAFAESYKTIRNAIQLSAFDAPPKKIIVTSVSPGEGKTTTALNIAIAMSQANKKILLIDADLRRPRIHKILQLKNGSGLSSYLSGAHDGQVVHESGKNNLFVLPSGPIPPNPSELLGSKRFQTMCEKFATTFDAIVIDSPPLLSVSDSLLIGKVMDGTILVARSAKTTHDSMFKGVKQLGDINIKILGVVINAVNMKKTGYGYYDSYQYYYSSDEN